MAAVMAQIRAWLPHTRLQALAAGQRLTLD
jgi:hypothetical protein